MRRNSNFCLGFLLFTSMSANAALMDLADVPLFIASTADPNVFFKLDDSGSMDWEVLTKPYWHHCAYDPNATGSYSNSTHCGWQITNGLIRSYGNNSFRDFTYLYRNDDNLYSDSCNRNDYNSVEACTTAGNNEWRFFSSDLNLVYYNPDTHYVPWLGPCYTNGNYCEDAKFNNARSNPRQGESGYNRSKNLRGNRYNVWIDDKGYDTNDARPVRAGAVNHTTSANNEVDLWDSHYEIILNAANAEIRKVTYAPNAMSMGETKTLEATLNNDGACYNILGSKNLVQDIFDGNLGVTSTGASGCRTLEAAQQNFANWYEYHRKRSLAAKSAVSIVVNQYPGFRYGLSVINDDRSLFQEVPASSMNNYSAHNLELLSKLYSYNWRALGTPLRQGLNRVGQYFDDSLSGHANPIIHSCQQNFAILLTDGFWNGGSPRGGPADDDGDGIAITVADVAKHYYDKDLSPLPNNVIPNPYDPATYQHMVTYTVAFGVSGLLEDTDNDGWPNPPLVENSNWGNPFNNDSAKIDDLWHAAYNSKGTFVQAQSADALADKLGAALSNITNRISSAASVAQNSTVLNTNSQIYQATFDSDQWLGMLLAYGISADGVVATTPTWNANCVLTGGDCDLPTIPANQNPGISHSQRVIITRDFTGKNKGIAFQWPNNYTNLKVRGSLPQKIYDFLQYAPYNPNTNRGFRVAANQDYGDKLVRYLRGDKQQEQQQGGRWAFRNRQGLLGDIINSSPLYVGPPDRTYPDALESAPYKTFKEQYANRMPLVFAGSNDGMLHAFRADNGSEVLAYIPGDRKLYKSLSEFSKDTYTHKYMVDGTPTEADVFYNGAWHTIISGALRKGGQTVYALDITDPNQFSEFNANKTYLWEFSDEDDADLGYIFGNVKIAKVKYDGATSKWAVIFGNGYNNSENDGHASRTGKASLFILFIEQGLDGNWTPGSDYIKITVGNGNVSNPEGLGEPFVVDIDGDFVADYIYAGDNKGNLWKFDIRDASPSNWQSNAYALYSAQYASANDQPITAPPIVGAHPTGLSNGVMVYFGTGKYLEKSDNDPTGAITQTFYGIWDKLDGTRVAKSDLLSQSIIQEVSINVDTDGDNTPDTSYDLRQLTDHPINWGSPQGGSGPAQHRGWHLDLVAVGAASNQGERQVSRPILRNGNIIFTTLIPSASPCQFGGDSWLMEVNAYTGGQPKAAPFDLNNDGEFDTIDYINLGDIDGDGDIDYAPPGGQKSKVGITSTPAVFLSGDKTKEVKVMSGSTGITSVTENSESAPLGRQNWKHILQ